MLLTFSKNAHFSSLLKMPLIDTFRIHLPVLTVIFFSMQGPAQSSIFDKNVHFPEKSIQRRRRETSLRLRHIKSQYSVLLASVFASLYIACRS